jgi:hypothetical protein
MIDFRCTVRITTDGKVVVESTQAMTEWMRRLKVKVKSIKIKHSVK